MEYPASPSRARGQEHVVESVARIIGNVKFELSLTLQGFGCLLVALETNFWAPETNLLAPELLSQCPN